MTSGHILAINNLNAYYGLVSTTKFNNTSLLFKNAALISNNNNIVPTDDKVLFVFRC